LGDRPLLEMIKTANVKKYGYIPLNNFWNCMRSDFYLMNFLDFYKSLGIVNFPEKIITCGSAQFIVSRERILQRSKAFYQKIFDKLVAYNKRDGGLEYVWHLLFGENIIFVPRDDHFEPPLKEILYSGGCDIPMFFEKFKIGYCGKWPAPKNTVSITTQEEFEYYKTRALPIFCFDGDEPLIEISDTNKLCKIPKDQFENSVKILENDCLEYESLRIACL
jgi:hypothetical protein